MKTALISISFRKLSVAEIARLCADNGLQGVEWGGDVHCPHGDVKAAAEAAKVTAGSGLAVSSYGSYYKVGDSEESGLPFEKVLDSAVALGAPRIRVWAGSKSSADATEDYRSKVLADLNRISSLATKAGVRVSLEYHLHSLTDGIDSALKLLSAAPDVLCQWQPIQGLSLEAKGESLQRLLGPRLGNIHVFEWVLDSAGGIIRRPLSEGSAVWRGWLKSASASPNCEWALLEFVKDDDPRLLAADAAALKSIIPI